MYTFVLPPPDHNVDYFKGLVLSCPFPGNNLPERTRSPYVLNGVIPTKGLRTGSWGREAKNP